MNKDKLLKKLLLNAKNIRFSDVQLCVEACGFYLSGINESHHLQLIEKYNHI